LGSAFLGPKRNDFDAGKLRGKSQVWAAEGNFREKQGLGIRRQRGKKVERGQKNYTECKWVIYVHFLHLRERKKSSHFENTKWGCLLI